MSWVLVGVYADLSTPPKNHGFLMRHGDFVSIDYPAQGSEAQRRSASIAGVMWSGSSRTPRESYTDSSSSEPKSKTGTMKSVMTHVMTSSR
jgi:hypothetical protein